LRARAVLLGALVESVCVLGTVLVGTLLTGSTGAVLVPASLVPASLVLGGAVAGVLMVRSLGARWPEPVWSSIVAGIGLLILITVAMPGASPVVVGQYPGAWRDQALGAFLFLAAGGAGMFLLPLAEPRVRRTGPAPAPARVAQAAVALLVLTATAMLLWARAAGPGWSYVALGVLAIGGIGGLIAIALGMGLTMLTQVKAGAWVGGLGLIAGLLALTVWLAAGRPWFP
jgi:hypothetical protein